MNFWKAAGSTEVRPPVADDLCAGRPEQAAAGGPFYPSCPSRSPRCPLSQLWLPDGREWKASWRTQGGPQPQRSPWPLRHPLTPSWAFEEDIYKPLVWQQRRVRLFYLPHLSRATTKEASCADGLTDRARADKARPAAKPRHFSACGTRLESSAARL